MDCCKFYVGFWEPVLGDGGIQGILWAMAMGDCHLLAIEGVGFRAAPVSAHRIVSPVPGA